MIYDRSGEPVAGVSISIPPYRYNEEDHTNYARLIRETAAAIFNGLDMVVK